MQNHLNCVLFRFIRSSDNFNVVIRFIIICPFYLFLYLSVCCFCCRHCRWLVARSIRKNSFVVSIFTCASVKTLFYNLTHSERFCVHKTIFLCLKMHPIFLNLLLSHFPCLYFCLVFVDVIGSLSMSLLYVDDSILFTECIPFVLFFFQSEIQIKT